MKILKARNLDVLKDAQRAGYRYICTITTHNDRDEEKVRFALSPRELSSQELFRQATQAQCPVDRFDSLVNPPKNVRIQWKPLEQAIDELTRRKSNEYVVHCSRDFGTSYQPLVLSISENDGWHLWHCAEDSTSPNIVRFKKELLADIEGCGWQIPEMAKQFLAGNEQAKPADGEFSFGLVDVPSLLGCEAGFQRLNAHKAEKQIITLSLHDLTRQAKYDGGVFLYGSQIINETGEPGRWSDLSVSIMGAEEASYRFPRRMQEKRTFSVRPKEYTLPTKWGHYDTCTIYFDSDSPRSCGYLEFTGTERDFIYFEETKFKSPKLWFAHPSDVIAHFDLESGRYSAPEEVLSALQANKLINLEPITDFNDYVKENYAQKDCLNSIPSPTR
ncbi:hypothetical protein [Reinekea sp. G2M2-21]|uniref:hypothetical protein n=1 Tax=Reinekea sp. G2M2-21 TaxID=2788942 RepID=UPI0018AC5555|nr:hypothetical protein [Reinekea sp. G2M2-21]